MVDPREIGTVTPLSEHAYAVVTGLQTTDGELLIGPVARGGCMVAGELACKATCQLWALRQGTADEQTTELVEAGVLDAGTILEEDPQACADENLANALEKLGVDPARALMVAVGANEVANRVGYLDDPELRAAIVSNSRGWSEVPVTTPYNAVYAKAGDTLPNGEPVELIGIRSGGSGVVVDDMKLTEGHVYGITHLPRTTMPGRGHEAVYDGKQQTYRRYAAGDSMQRYEAEPEAVTTHVIAAAGRETSRRWFTDRRSMENVLPGWAEDGLIENRTNPDWRPGMEVFDAETGEYDVLLPDYTKQVRRQVHGAAQELGVTDVRDGAILDPAVPSDGIIHSSGDRARMHEEHEGDGGFVGDRSDRDLYAIVFKSTGR